MAIRSSRNPYGGGNSIAQGEDMARRNLAFAAEVQRQNDKAQKTNNLQAAGARVPKSVLPVGGIHKGMSQADMDAANRAIAGYQGTLPAAPHMPGPTHMAGSGPAAALPPSRDPAQLAADAAALKEFQDSDPNKAATSNATTSKLTAAAGKGEVVNTPYGPASSTDATEGKGATWQEQIANKYPEIAKKGSDANLAFVEAYKNAQKQQGPNPDGSPVAAINPHALADQVMKGVNFRNEQDNREPGATAALNPNGNNAATAIPSGFDTGAPPPPSAASQAGTAVRNAGQAVASVPSKITGAINNGIQGATNAAGDFATAVTGSPGAGQAVHNAVNSGIAGLNSAAGGVGHIIGHAVAALTGYGATPSTPPQGDVPAVAHAHAPDGGEQIAQNEGGGGSFEAQPSQTRTAQTPTQPANSPTTGVQPYGSTTPNPNTAPDAATLAGRPGGGYYDAKGAQSPQNVTASGSNLDALNQHMVPGDLQQHMDPSSTAAGAQATPGEGGPTDFKSALTPQIQPYGGAAATAGASPSTTTSPSSTSPATRQVGIQPYSGNAAAAPTDDDEEKKKAAAGSSAAPVAANSDDEQ